ncbi:hypothetical protein [Micromonospora sp. S4605]|uniref:hypothetical protein n=1 Tax=Micromonospora sp. S4605 TaxID=1420897 RepID=UPI0011B3B9EC|nr:hypothetical protein [Micromonospora sp. S4605]
MTSGSGFEAACEVQLPQLNAQLQTRISWAPSFAVARARFDQLLRTCTTTVANRHNGPLTVTGVTCLIGATVSGPVTVRPGATLLAIDSSISGPVSASNAAAVHLYHSTVRGPVSVTGTTGSAAIVDTEIHGPAVLTGGTGTVEPIIADSTVRGPLACTGNSPAPINLGAANTVQGQATGQCAGLD